MKKKTVNVGRAPEPFPGSFDELRTIIAAQISAYDVTPQRGSLKAGRFLIVDEAQNLDLDCMRTALFLFDQAQRVRPGRRPSCRWRVSPAAVSRSAYEKLKPQRPQLARPLAGAPAASMHRPEANPPAPTERQPTVIINPVVLKPLW
jgi:hypothetical protein